MATKYPWGGSLQDGQTYQAYNGLEVITQISHNSTSVTFQVALGSANPLIVNSASAGTDVAPGGLATIYGISVAGAPTLNAATLPLPTELGGLQVMVNGVASPLLYVSATQINFQVPASTAVSSSGYAAASVGVYFNGQLVAIQPVSPMEQHAPGVFVVPDPSESGSSYANALVTYYLNGVPSQVYPTISANPQVPGTFQLNTISLDPSLGTPYLSLYATGLNGIGVVPTVLLYDGESPSGSSVATSYSRPEGEAGLDQINIPLPAQLQDGLVSVVIPNTSQSFSIKVGN